MPIRGADRQLIRSQRLAWLRLIRSENVGPVTFHQLQNRFGSVEAALEALPSLVRGAGLSQAKIASLAQAEDELGQPKNLEPGLSPRSSPITRRSSITFRALHRS